jgi:DNA (cytosine-5)-methyltransferase 1
MLMQRQNDGIIEPFPIWDDIRTFDGKPWRGIVDVVSGGFPCQDISSAGKGAGITGERSGLWTEMARVIREVRPRHVLVENSPMLVSRGLGVVLGDLAEMGFDARWGVLGAVHAGAPHKRERIWILATRWAHVHDSKSVGCSIRKSVDDGKAAGEVNASRNSGENVADSSGIALEERQEWKRVRPQPVGGREDVADPDMPGREEQRVAVPDGTEHSAAECGSWWGVEPGMGRMADGVANRVDRIKAIGNGQVPSVVRLAWKMLTAKMED